MKHSSLERTLQEHRCNFPSFNGVLLSAANSIELHGKPDIIAKRFSD